MTKKTQQLIRKALLLGVGAASYGAEAVEEAVVKLREYGELDEREAREVAKEFVRSLENKRLEAENTAKRGLGKASEAVPFATKAELKRLEQRVARLEKKTLRKAASAR